MPSINDLKNLKPIRSGCKSDEEYEKLSTLWEERMAPTIVRLEAIASTRPVKESFENTEELEYGEAYGYWMGRQGKVVSIHLTTAIREWQKITQP